MKVKAAVILLFPYSPIPLFPYSPIPLFSYSPILLFPYSPIPLSRFPVLCFKDSHARSIFHREKSAY